MEAAPGHHRRRHPLARAQALRCRPHHQLRLRTPGGPPDRDPFATRTDPRIHRDDRRRSHLAGLPRGMHPATGDAVAVPAGGDRPQALARERHARRRTCRASWPGALRRYRAARRPGPDRELAIHRCQRRLSPRGPSGAVPAGGLGTHPACGEAPTGSRRPAVAAAHAGRRRAGFSRQAAGRPAADRWSGLDGEPARLWQPGRDRRDFVGQHGQHGQRGRHCQCGECRERRQYGQCREVARRDNDDDPRRRHWCHWCR